jgi:phytoene synthase
LDVEVHASSHASFQTSGASVATIGRRARSSFSLAFRFLPRAQREALDAVYTYCRLVDDAVDEAPSPEVARANLAGWRAVVDQVFADGVETGDPTLAALRRAVRAFAIRRADMEAVIEGCEWDAERARYRTWEELREYCLRVASAVGLMCIEIFGYEHISTREYARDLGLALQLTNIVRDVDEDGARGRIYLPLEDLAEFGVDERDLLEGRRTPAVGRLLRFEAQRARVHYFSAWGRIPQAARDQLVAAEIMGDIYYALLEELEARGFPAGRVTLGTARKASLALRRFVVARLGRRREPRA